MRLITAADCNAALLHFNGRWTHAMWRRELVRHRDAAATARAAAATPLAVYATQVRLSAWQCAVNLRERCSRPGLDRVVGSGWDRTRDQSQRPGTSATSAPAAASTSAAAAARGAGAGQRDLDRYDLGRGHRWAAERLGGSDAAVLATHALPFALRFLRNTVIAVLTGAALAGGGLRGATVTGPAAAYAYMRAAPQHAGS